MQESLSGVGSPDLAGYTIDSVVLSSQLDVTDLGGSFDLAIDMTWEIYGH